MLRCCSLALLLLLLLPASPAFAQGPDIPCYNCRTAQCPTLEGAPWCPGAKPQRRKDPPPKPLPADPPPKPVLTDPVPEPPPIEARKPPAPLPAPAIQAPPLLPTPEPTTRRPLRGAAIGLGVGGLLAVGAGAALLALDLRYGAGCRMEGVIETCPQAYSTLPFGAPLLAVGGAAVVTAGVLLILDHRRSHKKSRWPA